MSNVDQNKLLYDQYLSPFCDYEALSPLPVLNVMINGQQLRASIDSASIKCLITNHTVLKCNLLKIVDKDEIVENYGIGTCKSIGKIWFLNLMFNESLNVNISADVINNLTIPYDIVLGNNFLQTYCSFINIIEKNICICDQIISFV
jgi:hypothetical protein